MTDPRSARVHATALILAEDRPVDPNRAPEDTDALASRGVQDLLAMEVEITQRTAKGDCRAPALIRRMCSDNPLWGAPRIHGELLKLGFEISQSTVSKYMPCRPTDPDQSRKSFLRNHMDCTASIDFLVVPTLTFKILFVLVVLSHERRRIVHFGITTNPSAE
ncbi:MAG: hypothetical protein GY791_03400 [Alphaproteobacteria bacterium]|nr:hypothetical protein [Alphaproteobacteria bacterium]